MDLESTIHDAYKVFEHKKAFNFIKPFIDAAPDTALESRFEYVAGVGYHRIQLSSYNTLNVNKFSKYITRTTGQLYVKMLMAMEKDVCSYHEIYARVLKPRGIAFGNDTLLWKSLHVSGLMEIDGIGKYKRKFFRLTSLGKLVVETAKKNDVAYKVLRHFMKFKDTLDEQALISIQINPETFNDMTPESYIAMLDAILSPSSTLHEVGSYAYWLNKLVECLKKSDAFFEDFKCQEVITWIESHMSNPYVKRFNDVFQKIIKKRARTAIAA